MSGCAEEGCKEKLRVSENPFLPRPRAGGWLWEPPSSQPGGGACPPISCPRSPAVFAGGRGEVS